MKLVTLTVMIASLPTVASAGYLRLYRNKLYSGIIQDRNITLVQPCKDRVDADNQASSMEWSGTATSHTEFTFS
ncbi:hypothetical protein L218DRAFT_963485 [Marasmius fiardii PR-910]|nr:hypothetical protein L218DRAFT_963485 [Marasmius fiardii PR-910]